MASIFVRHRVADYAKWKPIFDEHETVRREHAITGHSLHRDSNDPNLLVIALRLRDMGRAKEFAASEDLRQTMQRAGVQGPPEIWFTEDVEDKKYS